MTKEEVLQGALALGDADRGYTVSVEGNRIILRAEYRATPTRKGTFCCVAHLKDNGTYFETCSDYDGYGTSYGIFRKEQASVTVPLGGKKGSEEIKKETFSSEEVKAVLRAYLAECGYTRKSGRALTVALCIVIPLIAAAIVLLAVLLGGGEMRADRNAPDGASSIGITREETVTTERYYGAW